MPAMKSILIPSLFSLGALANAPTDYYVSNLPGHTPDGKPSGCFRDLKADT